MADQSCVAIVISSGVRCTKRTCEDGDGTRCKTHYNYVQTHGPHGTRRKELKAIHKKQTEELRDRLLGGNQLHNMNQLEAVRIHQEFSNLYRTQQLEVTRLNTELAEEVARLGQNPDREAIARRGQQRAQRRERMPENVRERNRWRLALARERLQRQRVEVDDLGRQVPQERNLRNFAQDAQNVHTVEAVRQTKEIIEKIRKIPVPEEYRWNLRITSKTAGEIITECKLSIHASCQMLTQYSHATAIYDIEEGIYGKTLDSAWQFIKAHPEKESLIAILKQELEDNIGMCAQGNLTRICNVLSGYMEGVAPPESLSEKLGRLLPPLMEIEDPYDRIYTAYKILQDNGVHMDLWDDWVGPLIDEVVEDTIDLNSLKNTVVSH